MAEPRRSGRFSYYARLSAPEKRTYRKSDEIGSVVLPRPGALGPFVGAVEKQLLAGHRSRLERAVGELCLGITVSLEVPPVRVLVRSVRPSDHAGELHGLYTWEKGKTPTIEVWMRTARNRRVVQFRTFLRTLLHEVCHHLDFNLLGLTDTFHTEGFFRRESSLMRQLVGKAARRPPRKPDEEKDATARPEAQLELFSRASRRGAG